MKQTCIVVLGMHRSGTSALTGTLNLLNIDLGSELMKANFANEKGFFENSYLMRFNDKLLRKVGSSWNDIFFDYDLKKDLITEDDLNELKNIFIQEFNKSTLFAIKDPRICYLFPVYEKVLKDLNIDIKVLLPYRYPIEVAQSLEKRNGFSIERGVALWLNHFLYAEYYSRSYKRCFLKFDNLISSTEESINIIDRYLDTSLKERYLSSKEQIENFLEAGLKHNNIDSFTLPIGIRSVLQEFLKLYEKDLNSVEFSIFDEMRNKNNEYKHFFGICCDELINEKAEHDKQIIDQITLKFEEREKECLRLRDQIKNIYLSKSWKITQPLRNIVEIFRNMIK